MLSEAARRFNQNKRFLLANFIIGTTIVVSAIVVTTYALLIESIERDGLLTGRLIQSLAEVEGRHGERAPDTSLAELPDAHHEPAEAALRQRTLPRLHREFLDHIAHLPDVRRVSLYGPDRVILWSTEPQLIGRTGAGDHLAEALASGETVSASHFGLGGEQRGPGFSGPPGSLAVDHYLPLRDSAGQVASLLEIHKAPADLTAHLGHRHLAFWLAAVLGGVLIQVGLFWRLRRHAERHRQPVASETVVALGEMSAAMAHSLRNPLAAIRSSAELALDAEDAPVRRNIEDIISQVDRLSKRVSELLIASRPLCGDRQAVDPVAAVDEALRAFDRQIRGAHIRVEWQAPPAPAVISHRVLLAQVLNSVIANAIEAMPRGGTLRIRLAVDALERRLRLTVGDSGNGMSREQMALAFKAFYTTKRGGLGIGLVLVKQIMERFGGSVRLDSREKEGTDVCLVFRIAEGE